MSERGSFVTQYIYCAECFEAAKAVLVAKHKGLCSTAIPTWESAGGELPIIAGKISESFAGGELQCFESEFIPALEQTLCHPLTIAVLPDNGQHTFFTAGPKV